MGDEDRSSNIDYDDCSECLDYEGSGKCSNCEDDGGACMECQGTGKCRYCEGTGRRAAEAPPDVEAGPLVTPPEFGLASLEQKEDR